MSPEAPSDGIEQARARLRASRSQIFALAHELRGDEPGGGGRSDFPRSRLMRALTGTSGKVLLGSALLALGLLRPALFWRLVRLMPQLQPLVLRYLAHRFLS